MNLQQLFSLDGKVAVVTGGSRGIGYMIAEGLLCAGVKVYVCARKAAELEAAVAALGAFGECRGVVCDISTVEGVEALHDEFTREEGALHLLVNNAGATWGAPLGGYARERFDNVLNVNLTAPFALTQRLLDFLREGAGPGDPARIINVASIDGLNPPVWETYAYGASKAGLLMLTRHLAGRLARDNITVNAIAPGLFPSKMTAFVFKENADPASSYGIPLRRTGDAEDIAGAVIYLASRAGAFVTGATIPVSGGSGVTRELEERA